MSKGPTRKDVKDLEGQIDDLCATIDRLKLESEGRATKATAMQVERDLARSAAAAKDQIIADQKDELMKLSLRYATLDGYVSRINEGDPMPPQALQRQFGPRIEAFGPAHEELTSGMRWWR